MTTSEPDANAELHLARELRGRYNVYVLGNYIVSAYYRDGITIHDISRPENMVLTGRYDTSPLSGSGWDGCWSVYPFTPSGRVYASDILQGLFVIDVDYQSAAWLEGIVSDASTSIPLANATVTILGTEGIGESDVFGAYSTGTFAAGTYDLQISALGFSTKIVSGITLTPGVVTNLDVELNSLPVTTISGQITDALTGAPVPAATIGLFHPDYSFETIADASGQFTFTNIYSLTYQANAGKWGYISGASATLDASTTTSWNKILDPGIYDDFMFDFGWNPIGGSWAGGGWERGEPVAYDPGYGFLITPGSDVPDDQGKSCYVTGNSYAEDIVHAGEAVLRSPEFDPRALDRATLRFSAWVFNSTLLGEISNDGLIVKLSDADGTVNMDTIYATSVDDPEWIDYEYELSTYKTLGAGMRVLFTAKADGVLFVVEDVLEVGVDAFRVEKFIQPSGITGQPLAEWESIVYPNPVNGSGTIRITGSGNNEFDGQALTLTIYSITGKRLFDQAVRPAQGMVRFEAKDLAQGLYLFELKKEGIRLSSGKFSVVH